MLRCREGSCGDRAAPSRELGPLPSSSPPATAPESGPGAVASNRGARDSFCIGTGAAATSGGGTSPATQVQYYLDRPRSTGDFHGQAPLLWTASALMH
jgi:hypothetical protein